MNSLKKILQAKRYSNYYKQCQIELIQAKNTKLENSWISFYNLLVDDRKKLKNYAGNKHLIADFRRSDCVKKFPIYGESMNENVKRGIIRRELFDRSSIVLSKCLLIFNPNYLIIRDLLDCILSKKNLRKLCQ